MSALQGHILFSFMIFTSESCFIKYQCHLVFSISTECYTYTLGSGDKVIKTEDTVLKTYVQISLLSDTFFANYKKAKVFNSLLLSWSCLLFGLVNFMVVC